MFTVEVDDGGDGVDTEKIKSIEQPRRGTLVILETTGPIKIPVNIYTYKNVARRG